MTSLAVQREAPFVSGRSSVQAQWAWLGPLAHATPVTGPVVAWLTVDAVLIYAQKGSGKRSNLFTDYTFAVWRNGELVPFAKAYSGLTDAEIRVVDRFVRANTIETFGPVRSVKPQLVFEIAFEAIQKSTRHKSGVAVRFPRILRFRDDKTIEQADSIETIHEMLENLRS